MALENIQPSMNLESLLGYARKFGVRTIPGEYQTKEFALAILEFNPAEYQNLKPELKNDREVTLYAASLSGWTLYYTSDELKDDFDIVFAAVKRNRDCLYLASERLQNNTDILEYVNNDANYNEFDEGIIDQHTRWFYNISYSK